MKRLSTFTLLICLCGCVAAGAVPPEGTPFVRVYTGNGGFSGYVERTVYADDTIVTSSAGPGGKDQKTKVEKGAVGVFLAVQKVVADEGPQVRVTSTESAMCLDYGQDMVTANPPIAGFSSIAATCPEPAMEAFYRKVLAAMDPQ
jgi:hypothetical protein